MSGDRTLPEVGGLQPKPPSAPACVIADQIAVTFPFRGNVAKEAGEHKASRMIWSKRGRLKGVRAIDGVSFSLHQGDRLAIVGENGSGKTTLLQALAGILTPEIGTLKVRGRITSLININLGTQPEATGHRNITLRGLAAGYTHKQIEAKRQEIAEFSELAEFLNMPIETYSAGMRMRLVFSIATAFEPEILVLDEWLSAGDVAFKEKATRRMNDFVEKAGILILASHSRKLILDNCKTGLWMDEGKVRAMGPVEEIIDAYEEAQHEKKREKESRSELRLATSC